MKFEVGKSYEVRWIGDSSIKDSRKVLSRTNQTVTLDNGGQKKIFVDQDGEYCYPEGKYSKAPVMRAVNSCK